MTETKLADDAEVIAYLDLNQGTVIEIARIVSYFKASNAAMRQQLILMSSRGAIRSGYVAGKVGYFIPTPAQIEAEQVAIARSTCWTPEHKVSKERSDLYARLNAERTAVPSIG